ncbi:MAG: VOC family protein [Pseudomonadota bacterium]
MTTMPRFHLAFPVHDLSEARRFYGEILGCPEGRSSDEWVDFDLFGHQIVAHMGGNAGDRASNPVDGHDVPIPHFGLILEREEWNKLADKMKGADVSFIIEPEIRFEGLAGEQAIMFVRDPSGNALEFKSFADDAEIFRKQDG